jgi:hypothetical protein
MSGFGFLLIVVVIMLLSIAPDVVGWLRLRKYWLRPCMGRAWRIAFPDAPKQDLRDFLNCVAGAFGFPEKRFLSLHPEDRIMRLYSAANPPILSMGVDGYELERFAEAIERRFSLEFDRIESAWHKDIALRDLFDLTRK